MTRTYVVGSVPALGSWAPAGAVKLTAQGGGVYRAVVNLPAATTVEFKFLKTTAGVVTWESGSNRTVTTPTSGTSTVTDTFGESAGTQGASSTVNATTSYGQNVFLVGSVAALGSWNPANAVALFLGRLSAVAGHGGRLPANTTVDYKYLKKNPDGTVTWESGGNRSATIPSTGTWSSNDTWR